MHIIQVLYDQTVVNSIERFTEIYTGSQDSMGLPEIKGGMDKVEKLDQVVSNGEAFQSTLARVKIWTDDR